MKKLRYFKCASTQSVFERFVSDNTESVDCECKAKAVRQLSSPRCFSNTVGKSPSC